MARKSRKNVTPPETPKKTAAKVWRAALYIRLSSEFNGKRGDSLETQRQIMEAYIALCPDIDIIAAYTDNGITGRTFERAAFQQMLTDIENGKIDCIVVKDLSRLGRNAIDTGYYIEKYFPLHHVRFIAVNDQYDSEDSENNSNHLIVPLKNMINEAYAADISRKVRSQQQQSMKDGEYSGSCPPYGYIKSPNNCHKLLVDETAAPIVRQIFQWAADGDALPAIVKRLNQSGTPAPGQHLTNIGYHLSSKAAGCGEWHTWAISNILSDAVYIGDMVRGKKKKVGHKSVAVSPENWVIVHNTHEPLVSQELFNRVQAIRKEAAIKSKSLKRTAFSQNILRGRIFCGQCGRPLLRGKGGSRYYFHCVTNQRMGGNACKTNPCIREDVLFDIIVTIIRQEAESVIGNNLLLKQENGKIAAQKASVDKEITKLRQETENTRMFLSHLWENFVSGILTQTEYLEMKEGYNQKIAAAVERVQELQEQQRSLEGQIEEYTSLADILASVNENTSLSVLLVDQLIESVVVNSRDDVSIHFRFENGFEELMGVMGRE